MTGQAAIFSKRMIVWLIAAGALAFIGMSYLMIYGEEFGDRNTASASSYSSSAIGHGAFVELLRQSDIPVLVSKYDTFGRAGSGNLVILAEPESMEALQQLSRSTSQNLESVIAGPTLIVLPKRSGEPAWGNDHWIGSSTLVPIGSVEAILDLLSHGSVVIRPGHAQAFSGAGQPDLPDPQLIRSFRFRPVIASDQGMLLGVLGAGVRRIWVLADPDVLANHGIGNGDNAAFILSIIDQLRPEGGTVLIDETIHGFTRQPNLWRAIFEPPFVLATVQVAAVLAMLVWAAVGRFGPPLKTERVFAPGAATLLDTSAGLLKPGRHGGRILRRYGDGVARDVAERLHAPQAATDTQRAEWFDRVGRVRKVGLSFREIEAELVATDAAHSNSAARLTAIAGKLHQWKRDMLDGS